MVKKNGITTLSIHSVTNMLGNPKAKDFEKTGINLNQTDYNVVLALAKAFSLTDYQGNLDPILDNRNPFVQALPRIQITRSELLKLLKISPKNTKEIKAFFCSLDRLNSKMFDFRYERLCFDKNGLPIKLRSGKWKKQIVETKDSLFRIKYLRHKDSNLLQSLEIVMSSVFIDQRESYFLSIPDSAKEELEKALESKRVPAALLNLILYFKYQQELRRRGKRSWKIKILWDDLAKIVRVTSLSIKRKKGQVIKTLEKGMVLAKNLNYLESWEFVDDHFNLTLAPSKTKELIKFAQNMSNRKWLENLLKDIDPQKDVIFGAYNIGFEICGAGGASQPKIVEYEDPLFQEKVKDLLKKFNLKV